MLIELDWCFVSDYITEGGGFNGSRVYVQFSSSSLRCIDLKVKIIFIEFDWCFISDYVMRGDGGGEINADDYR